MPKSKKKINPPASTGMLHDIRDGLHPGVKLTTMLVASDVRDDMRAIGLSEGRNMTEQVDIALRRYIAAFPASPEVRALLISPNRPLPAA